MSSWFVVVLLLLSCANWPCRGQESVPPQPDTARRQASRLSGMTETRVGELAAALQLDNEQKQRLQSILSDDEQQERDIRQQTRLLPQEKQEKLRDLHAATRTQIEAVLTPEQRVQLAVELEIIPAQTAQQAVAWLAQHVQLTNEQKSELQRVIAEQQKQAQAVKLDRTLVSSDKRDRILRLRREAYRQVMGILTGEQQQQLRDSPRPLLQGPLFDEWPL